MSAPALRKVGDYLRETREARKRNSLDPREHSIDAYARKIGWPTSKLRQVEVSRKHMMEPCELRKLAEAYDVPYERLVSIAGFVDIPEDDRPENEHSAQ